jgi:hypothetical protein
VIAQRNALIYALTGNLGQTEGRASPYASSRVIAKRHKVWQLEQPWTEPKPGYCPCECWTLADALWQTMTEEQRELWRAAVKAPKMSGYDVWMKEALSLCTRGLNLPDRPGPGGGYSAMYALPGSTPPPASCLPEQPHVGWRCTGDPDWLCQECPWEDRQYDTEAECLEDCIEPPPEWEDPDGSPCAFCSDIPPLWYTVYIENPEGHPDLPATGDYLIKQTPDDNCIWGGPQENPPYMIVLWKLEFLFRLVTYSPTNGCELTWEGETYNQECDVDLYLNFTDRTEQCDREFEPPQLHLKPGFKP